MAKQKKQAKKKEINKIQEIVESWSKLPKKYRLYYDIHYTENIYNGVYQIILFIADHQINREYTKLLQFHSKVNIQTQFVNAAIKRERNIPITGFLLDKEHIEKWPPPEAEKKNYKELLKYIEQIRLKNFHRQLTGIGDERIEFMTFLDNIVMFPVFTRLEKSERSIVWGDGLDIYKILYDCARLLNNEKEFPKVLSQKIAEICDLILEKKRTGSETVNKYKPASITRINEDFQKSILARRYLAEITGPPLDQRYINRAEQIRKNSRVKDVTNYNCYDYFISPLYEDLLQDINKSGYAKICAYRYCSIIFYKDESNKSHWKSMKCCCINHTVNEARIRRYEKKPQPSKDASKKARKKEKKKRKKEQAKKEQAKKEKEKATLHPAL